MAAEISTIPKVSYPYAAWQTEGAEMMFPIKGTWTLPPPYSKTLLQRIAKDVCGLISCPNCGTAAVLTDTIVTPDLENRTAIVNPLHCSGCPFTCEATLQQWDQRKLYCVAYEHTIGLKTKPVKEYFHGLSTADIQTQFHNGHMHDQGIIKVVAIGRVIGYWVDDTQGNKLHV